jgi:plasmid maintenance system antidote protein VapI
MAIRFSVALGTTPNLWLNLQTNHDLWKAVLSEKNFLIGRL